LEAEGEEAKDARCQHFALAISRRTHPQSGSGPRR
jgi:hypothetical protein